MSGKEMSNNSSKEIMARIYSKNTVSTYPDICPTVTVVRSQTNKYLTLTTGKCFQDNLL